MLKFVCLALFVALASAKINFKACGGEIKDVEVSGCTQTPCTLHKGKEVTITVEFVPNEDSKKAEIEIIAKVGELELQVPGIETDACKFMKCPLKKGVTETLKYTLTIPSIAPTIEADVTAKLVGDGGKVLACGTVHGSLKD